MKDFVVSQVLPSRLYAAGLAALLLSAGAPCSADTIYTDQNKLFRSARQVTPLGASLFGDKVNLYTGALEFSQTDVALPGNSRLPVSIGRRLIANRYGHTGLFGSWDLEIPHLHGIFSKSQGWVPLSGGASARCSNFSQPPTVSGSYGSLSVWKGTEYWHGSFLYVPGLGDQELLRRSHTYETAPTGNGNYTYPIVTRNNWQVRCLPTMDPLNGSPGEAFVAVSPDGTEYRFDWMVSRDLEYLSKPYPDPDPGSGSVLLGGSLSTSGAGPGSVSPAAIGENALARKEVWILPTRITDRFGNTVIYTYDTTNKWQLKSIAASDGTGTPRTITLNYLTPGSTASYLVSSVSDGTRTWTYHYGGLDGRGPLQTVTLPDNSTWQLGGLDSLLSPVGYLNDGNCEEPGPVNAYQLRGTATHPSGATAEFVLDPVRHGRVGVPQQCIVYIEPTSQTPFHPKLFDTYALTKKTITGPGLPAMTWSTTYSNAISSWAPWDGKNGTKQVEIRDPEGNVTRHTFGTVFMRTEGQLQLTEQFDSRQGLVRSTALQYSEPVLPRGVSEQRRGDGEMAARVMEVSRREIIQQGTTFLWEVNSFNEFAQPAKVTRSSSQGTSRVEATTYNNNLSKWVLGQVETVTEEGTRKQLLSNEYNSVTANLEATRRYGLLEKTMTYHSDGSVAGEKDGLNQETRYDNYRRGIPQNIAFADGVAASAVVNNLGGLDSVTDASGATTRFGYDAMGRFASISYPAGDPVSWNPTTLLFEQIWTPEYDLPPGHWRQTIKTGAGVETNYFDALWRPVYSERWDGDSRSITQRILKHQYDTEGRTTFDSYPVRTYGEIGPGVRRTYDVLGRLVATDSDSELGLIHTSVQYDASLFRKVQTDARGHSTSYGFQVFDQPSEDAITTITAPEGVNVEIRRDVFDKPLAITRSGGGRSLTRSYVYDSHQRLCKTIEPEIGTTIQDYDAAGNVAWRASGIVAPSATSCDTGGVSEVKRTRFSYDARNRLEDTVYGDGSAGITRTYTADGLLETISSGGSVWTYEYNKRRLNTAETLSYGGRTYRVGRSYDANGSLAQLAYPLDNLVINYGPNALGEAGKVGGYATGIQYYANGAVATFYYGNGIRRDLKQNMRGLPERSTDVGVLDETYVYDANGNVEQIADSLGGGASRQMSYDALDRLLTVSAPSLWGTATYGYDGLDNLVSTSISAGPNARTLTHNIDPNTNRLSTISGGPAIFNFGYGYDEQGNVTRRGTQIYRFDQGNRMTVAEGRATYAYDGLGRRFSTVGSNQVNTLQIYTQDGKLLYSGSPTGGGAKYIYLNNHVIAEAK